MPFLAITCFLMYANLIATLRCVKRGGGLATTLGAGHLVAGTAGAVGFLLGTELLAFDRDGGLAGAVFNGGIAGDAFNWTPVAYLVLGLLSALLFALKLRAKAGETDRDQGPGLVFGMTLWAVLAGVYVSGTAMDHLVFFRDSTQTGQMDVAFSGAQMTCSGGVILVRMQGDTAVYRCPKSIRLGQDYQAPFVPWPSYTEGSSTALKARIDEVLQQVAQQKDVVSVPAGEIKIYPNKGKTAD